MGMVKVTVVTDAGPKPVVMLPDSTTLGEVFGRYNINYRKCTNSVNHSAIPRDDIDEAVDMPLSEFNVGTEALISSIVKQDCGAKVIIAGNAVVIVSSVKLEDWKTALKFDTGLGNYDENGDMDFGVAIDEDGAGSLNENGVVFTGVPNNDGYAQATILLEPGVENKVEAVKEALGEALMKLNNLEADMPDIVETAKKYDKEITDNIIVM